MVKPRVIIVDTDLNYIVPIQVKFAKEYFEKIELEVITDAEIFRNKFSKPQSANVLIIADNLYDSSLQKHNIANIYLMSEQEENERLEGINVTTIYKYTNIKSIFSQILRDNLGSTDPYIHKDASRLILVTSACGGTGKTTLALAACQCLAMIGKTALYINADYLQSFQYRLADRSPLSDLYTYTNSTDLNNSIYDSIRPLIRKEGYYYIPPFKADIMSVGLDYSIYEKLAEDAKASNEYDYVIVDAVNTFDEVNARLMKDADKVIIVTKQNPQAAFATKRLISNINGISSDKYILVCNDFKQTSENALLQTEFTSKFAVNEYIEHISDCDSMTISEIAKLSAFQKIALLIT